MGVGTWWASQVLNHADELLCVAVTSAGECRRSRRCSTPGSRSERCLRRSEKEAPGGSSSVQQLGRWSPGGSRWWEGLPPLLPPPATASSRMSKRRGAGMPQHALAGGARGGGGPCMPPLHAGGG